MSNHKQVTLDREKILSQVERLAEVAKDNDWQFDYDADIDELVFGRSLMPRDSFIFNVNDEINLFVSPNSVVSGVHIEYFKSNFLEHNKELKPVLNAIEKRSDKSKKDFEATTALEIEISADAFKSLFPKDKLVTAI